jgi:hypothetical protein
MECCSNFPRFSCLAVQRDSSRQQVFIYLQKVKGQNRLHSVFTRGVATAILIVALRHSIRFQDLISRHSTAKLTCFATATAIGSRTRKYRGHIFSITSKTVAVSVTVTLTRWYRTMRPKHCDHYCLLRVPQ